MSDYTTSPEYINGSYETKKAIEEAYKASSIKAYEDYGRRLFLLNPKPSKIPIIERGALGTKIRAPNPFEKASDKPNVSSVPEKTVYSVPSTEKTLTLSLAGREIGNLLKMPDFSVNAVYDEQVMQKLMSGIARLISESLDVIGQMIPTVDLDLGNTTFNGFDGIQETMKAYMAMHGVSVFSNGIFTRKYFDHVAHQRYSFSLRSSHEQLNNLMGISTTFMPRPFPASAVKEIAEGMLGMLRSTSWMKDPDTGKSFASEYFNKIGDDVDNAVNQGILTLDGTSGVSATKLASTLKKTNDSHDAKIDKLVDNYLDITPETKELAKKDFSWTEGFDNFDIAKAKFKMTTRDAVIGMDKISAEEIEKVAGVIGVLANATSVEAPLQFTSDSLRIWYGGNDVTSRIIQSPASKGLIYKHQHLVIDSLTINPSEAMMTSSSTGMTPLYYDIDISFTTTMTPVAK